MSARSVGWTSYVRVRGSLAAARATTGPDPPARGD